MRRILLTGIGGNVACGIARSLRESGESFYIVGCDCDRYNIVFGKRWADKLYLVPRASEEGYINAINRIVEKEEIELIIPSPDPEVYELAKAAEHKALKAKIFAPPFKTVETVQDKWKTYLVLSRAGVPVAKTKLVKRPDDIKDALREWGSPIWLRAYRGAGGKGSIKIRGLEMGVAWVNYWDGWGKFLASEYLPGRNYCWTGIFKEGELITSAAFERVRYFMAHIAVSGVSGNINVGRVIHDDRVNRVGEEAVRAVDEKPNGVFSVDLRENKDKTPCVTEINARFVMPHYLFTAAGANFPLVLVKLAFNEEPPKLPRYNAARKGIITIRATDNNPIVIREEELDKLYEKAF